MFGCQLNRNDGNRETSFSRRSHMARAAKRVKVGSSRETEACVTDDKKADTELSNPSLGVVRCWS